LALLINTYDLATTLLPELPGSRVYFSGHDDFYVHVETIDPTLPARLLSRFLALFAGSALLSDGADILTIDEPDQELAEHLLQGGTHWAGTIVETHPGRRTTLRVAARTRPWSLTGPLPADFARILTFDLETSTWTHNE